MVRRFYCSNRDSFQVTNGRQMILSVSLMRGESNPKFFGYKNRDLRNAVENWTQDRSFPDTGGDGLIL